MTHPGPCLRCSLPWRSFGPHGLLECDNEHVFVRNTDGTLTEKVYPEFTDQQIRTVEVEMYREGVLDSIPDRRAALARLRYWHDQDRTDAEYASSPRPSETPMGAEGWSEYAYMNSEEHP